MTRYTSSCHSFVRISDSVPLISKIIPLTCMLHTPQAFFCLVDQATAVVRLNPTVSCNAQ